MNPRRRAASPVASTAVPPQVLGTTGLLWLIGALWYLLCEAIAATAYPGYSYAYNYISDLGVPEVGVLQGRQLDSPLHVVMNAGFLGEGLLFLLGLVRIAPWLRRRMALVLVVTLGVLHAIGIALVALVPGSEVNANNGLIAWHVLGAILAIAGGNLVAALSPWGFGINGPLHLTGPLLGSLGFTSAALLTIGTLLPDGVWERGAVYTFIAWLLLTGITFLQTPLKEPAARTPNSTTGP